MLVPLISTSPYESLTLLQPSPRCISPNPLSSLPTQSYRLHRLSNRYPAYTGDTLPLIIEVPYGGSNGAFYPIFRCQKSHTRRNAAPTSDEVSVFDEVIDFRPPYGTQS